MTQNNFKKHILIFKNRNLKNKFKYLKTEREKNKHKKIQPIKAVEDLRSAMILVCEERELTVRFRELLASGKR